MSTIGVTYHNEDIHNIIKVPVPPIIKSPRYKSKRNANQAGTTQINKGASKTKSSHKTFGLPHYEAPDSHNYLRKNSGYIRTTSIDKKQFACTSNCSLPPLPKFEGERPKPTARNFVKENIKWVDSLEPKVPQPRRVDSPRGTVKDLTHWITIIKKRESDSYGKVPEYLTQRKKQIEMQLQRKKRQEEIKENYKKQMAIGTKGMGDNVYMIDKETREKLLQGLKEHWNELSKQFLKLPVMCDTMTKIKRKLWLENEIDRIERDVKMVESHPYIFLERKDKRNPDEIAEDILRQQEADNKAEKSKKVKEAVQDSSEEQKKDEDEVQAPNNGEENKEDENENKEHQDEEVKQ